MYYRGYHVMPWLRFEAVPTGLLDERLTTMLPRQTTFRYIFSYFISFQIIVKETNFTRLLGFRQNCLSACAEQSSWTRFCEVDSLSCVVDFFNGNKKWECHLSNIEIKLKQPIKLHNNGIAVLFDKILFIYFTLMVYTEELSLS